MAKFKIKIVSVIPSIINRKNQERYGAMSIMLEDKLSILIQ